MPGEQHDVDRLLAVVVVCGNPKNTWHWPESEPQKRRPPRHWLSARDAVRVLQSNGFLLVYNRRTAAPILVSISTAGYWLVPCHEFPASASRYHHTHNIIDSSSLWLTLMCRSSSPCPQPDDIHQQSVLPPTLLSILQFWLLLVVVVMVPFLLVMPASSIVSNSYWWDSINNWQCNIVFQLLRLISMQDQRNEHLLYDDDYDEDDGDGDCCCYYFLLLLPFY